MGGEKEARGAKPLALQAGIPSMGIPAGHGGYAPIPPKWKPRKERRSKVVTLDFRPEDYETIKKAAERKGFRLRTFCRKAVLEAAGKSFRLPSSTELAQAYRELAYQISKIGNNLNQIAKWANQNRALDRDWLERLELIDHRLQKLLERLEP